MFKKITTIFCLICGIAFTATISARENTELDHRYSDDDGVESQRFEDSEESGEYFESEDELDYSAKQNFTLESGESLSRSENSKRYYAEIEKILAGADFAQREKVTRRRIKDVTDEETREDKFPQWVINFVKALESMDGGIATFAKLLEIFVWTLVIGLITFLVIKYRTQLQNWASSINNKEIEPELPTSLFGLDIKKDSIPDDVVMTAQGHWSRGDNRQAVAVLLRSSLIKLLHEHSCRFFSSDTEAECCDRIDQQATQDVSSYMRILVAVWQRIAYAHIDPTEDKFEQLCVQWREVF